MKQLYVQAEVLPGAWKLPDNEVWSVPRDTNEVRFDFETTGCWRVITQCRGLAITRSGKIFGLRNLNAPKESGYVLEGRASVGGKNYRAFTCSQLFEREDRSLCSVGVLVICGFDP